jgi:hypothetical protein
VTAYAAEPELTSEVEKKLIAMNLKHRKEVRALQREAQKLTGHSQWEDTMERETISNDWDNMVDRYIK